MQTSVDDIEGLGKFAEDAAGLIERNDLDELMHMATLDELKAIAKDFQLSPPKVKKLGKIVTTAWTVRKVSIRIIFT